MIESKVHVTERDTSAVAVFKGAVEALLQKPKQGGEKRSMEEIEEEEAEEDAAAMKTSRPKTYKNGGPKKYSLQQLCTPT